ncbi:unnamed protein product [Caenorhabditis angaria]|uniref:WD40 repeat-like protein n=1 Tax=Caenorhabditis angaria TaxID=860376 RepID=A0A9P1J7Q5_9PELO|nr:unnamed protein product [Caenorhabditis angaria]
MLPTTLSQREIEPTSSFPSVSAYFDEDYLVKSLRRTSVLNGHDGPVNALRWNKKGTLLASGSNDKKIKIWQNGTNNLLHSLEDDNLANIFSVEFLPGSNDNVILSGGDDKLLHINHIENNVSNTISVDAIVRRICSLESEPNSCWLATEDGHLRQIDTRINEVNILMSLPESSAIIKTMAVCAERPFIMALGLDEAEVPLYDRRIPSRPFLKLKPGDSHTYEHKTNHVEFSKNGQELIVNQLGGSIVIFDTQRGKNPQTLDDAYKLLEDPAEFEMIHRNNLPFEELRHPRSHILVEKNYLKGYDYYGELMATTKIRDLRFLSVLHSNRATCLNERLYPGDWWHSIKECVKALKLHQGNSKAIWRMGQAAVGMENYDLAYKCCEVFKKRFPNDESISKIEKQLEQRSELSSRAARIRYDIMDYKERYLGSYNKNNTNIRNANFFGSNDQYIVGGSDCGSMIIWSRATGGILGMWKSTLKNANICEPHPELLKIAASGEDPHIRMFECCFEEKPKRDEEEDNDGPYEDPYKYLKEYSSQRTINLVPVYVEPEVEQRQGRGRRRRFTKKDSSNLFAEAISQYFQSKVFDG